MTVSSSLHSIHMAADTIKIKCPQCGTTLKLNNTHGLRQKTVMCPKCGFKGLFTVFQELSPANSSGTASRFATPPADNNSPLKKFSSALSAKQTSPKREDPVRNPRMDVKPHQPPIIQNPTPGKDVKIIRNPTGGTVISSETKLPLIGTLRDESGKTYPLVFGLNSIGREAPTSSARIRIHDSENRISREHLIIEVKMAVQAGNLPQGTVMPGSRNASAIAHTVRMAKQHINKTYLNGMRMTFGFEYNLKHADKLTLPGNKSLTFILE